MKLATASLGADARITITHGDYVRAIVDGSTVDLDEVIAPGVTLADDLGPLVSAFAIEPPAPPPAPEEVLPSVPITTEPVVAFETAIPAPTRRYRSKE